MNKGQGILGEARLSRLLVDGLRRHAHQAHFERSLSCNVNTVALFS